jgi:hypothetical protein
LSSTWTTTNASDPLVDADVVHLDDNALSAAGRTA